MKEERMKILELLEQGKVNAEEASKLLETLSQTKHGANFNPRFHEFHSFDNTCNEEERLNRFSQSVDQFAKEFSDKMSSKFKDMEPKLRAATKTVVEKTAMVADEISKALNESLKNFEKNENCCTEEKDCCCTETKEDECCTENKEECCCTENKETPQDDNTPKAN